MPKIPTFTTQARPTAEVGDVRSNIQISPSQNIAAALAPITKTIMNYAAVEKLNQSKNEALELENQSILELNTVVQEASKLKNKEQANTYLINESKRIRDVYGAKASNSQVKSIFDNNYLKEEQKQLIKVDNAVYKNTVESYANNKLTKQERILTEGLFGKNPLAEKTMMDDLTQLELDDTYQDIDTREKNIASIPGKIDYFKAKRSINENPTQALKDIRLGLDGPYKNLTIKARQSLESDALTMARPAMVENVKDHLARVENGIESQINHKDVQDILGKDKYREFAKLETITFKTRDGVKEIYNSEIGKEQKIVDNFIKDPSKASILDLEAKNKLEETISKKNKLLQKDPASLIIQTDNTVKDLYNDFVSETDNTAKSEKFKKYIGAVKEAQINMGLNNDRVKVVPNGQALGLVKQYEDLKTPNEKIGFLNGLEQQYGDNYGILLKQLTENKLPITAKLVSYFGDSVFAEKALSIDSKEERDRLDNFLQTSDQSKKDVKIAVGEKLKDFRTVVMTSNPYDTSRANKELDEIQEIMTYLTINEMSRGTDLDDAAEKATDILNKNFELKETYFIPRIFNNQELSDKQINFISQKAEKIKTSEYLDLINIIPFKSTDKNISDNDLNDEMKNQLRSNSVWLNKADGEGIFLAIKFKNGEFGEVLMQGADGKPKRIEMNFDDKTFLVPGTDIFIDLVNRSEEIKPEGL